MTAFPSGQRLEVRHVRVLVNTADQRNKRVTTANGHYEKEVYFTQIARLFHTCYQIVYRLNQYNAKRRLAVPIKLKELAEVKRPHPGNRYFLRQVTPNIIGCLNCDKIDYWHTNLKRDSANASGLKRWPLLQYKNTNIHKPRLIRLARATELHYKRGSGTIGSFGLAGTK